MSEQLLKCFWCERHCHADCANLIYGDSYVAQDFERLCSCDCQYRGKKN